MVNQDKVAIFWDFENCCPPSTQGLGYDIVNNIGRMARIFGSVTTFKAYLDISSQPPKSTALRSELQLSGVSVVDCPHNGKKDVVDKMAMVDMFAFAVDNPAPATVILIAADRDYAYALSTLRLRNYKVVLITPCVSTCLEACASFVIDWNVALTKTRTESKNDSVRRPYVDIEASLFDRLSQEVSQFGKNLTVISAPLEAIKPQRINAQDLLRPSVPDNDANVTSESKFAQGSSEGANHCTSGNDDSSVSVTPAPKVPASPHHSSLTLPSLLRTHNIRSDTVTKPSGEVSRLVTGTPLIQSDTCLRVSDDADAITERSDSFVSNSVENRRSSKDEPPSSLLTGSLSDTSQKKLVDMPILETARVVAPLSRSSPPKPAVGSKIARAFGLANGNHHPADDLTAGRSSSPLFHSSLHGCRNDSSRNIPPMSANGDNNTGVPAEDTSTSCQKFTPSLKATSLPVERQSTPTNPAGGVSTEPRDSDNSSGVSSPIFRATFNVVPGSPALCPLAWPASDMPTNTATEQANRQQIRWQFLPLIRVLVADRHRRVFRSNRSDVAMAVLQIDKNAYKRVGATKFKHYTFHAERVGLVVLGGAEGDAWIALHPKWFCETERTEYQSIASMEDDLRAVDGDTEQIVAPLSGPSPPIPAIATDLATAHCFHKGDHPPADILTTGRISSPFSQPSLHGSRIPPISANSDNNTIVPADKSSTNIVPSQKEPTLSTEKQMTYANSVEGIAKEPMGNRNPFRISFPASHAALNVIPGSPVAQTQACPASDMPTSTATGQVNRKQTRWQFLPLIRVLVVDRRKRIFRSNHSDIAMALMQIDKNAYKRVGATRFKHYITLAQRVGLVVLGGAENDAWIALHPEWFSEAERTEYQSNTAMEGNSCGVDGNQTSTSREIGAGCFQPLVDILVQFHQSGVRPVLRSRIGQMLEPTVYQEAGVPGFAEYVARAAEVGIVMCGGVGGYAWIRLHPDVETQVNDTYHM